MKWVKQYKWRRKYVIKNDQLWFITGANRGLGAAIAKEALDRGYKVVATARKLEGMEKVLGNSPNLLTVKLDITNDGQVQHKHRKSN
jgi:NADP-dependent 3-hydroxy acid dehydrogenase YdfG